MEIGNLIYRITGDSSALRAELAKTNASVKESGTGLGKLGSIIGKVFAVAGITYAAKKIFDFGKTVVAAGGESQKTLAQLNQTLESTNYAAGMTSKELQDLAQSLSETTAYEDDAILKSEALLLTFTRIGKEVFPDAQRAILDVASAMGGDLQGATIQVGKALNDPIRGVAALTRVGVQFNEQQKQQIKTMMEANNVAGAQAVILKELQTQFGGQAVAQFKDNPLLAFTKVGQNIENIYEGIADELQPQLMKLANTFLLASSSGGSFSVILRGIGKGLGIVANGVTKAMSGLEQFIQYFKLQSFVSESKENAKAYEEWKKRVMFALEMSPRLKKAWEDPKRDKGEGIVPFLKRMNANTYLEDLDKIMSKQRSLATSTEDAYGKMTQAAVNYDKAFDEIDKKTDKELAEEEKKRKILLGSINGQPSGTGGSSEGADNLRKTQQEIAGQQEDELAKKQQLNEEELMKLRSAAHQQNLIGILTAISMWDRLYSDVNKSEEEIEANRLARSQLMRDMFAGGLSELTNILSAVQQYQNAVAEQRIADIDRQMQAELEAAGLTEDTEIEKLQKEYEEAKAKGDMKLADEKEKELKKAEIEEKYRKKKAKAEYEAAVQSWEIQRALAIAQGAISIINAYSSAAAIPFIGWIMAPIAAAAAGVAAALQIAAVEKSKPQASQFAAGGYVVPGSVYQGDKIDAKLNSGEMVLNQGQQRELFDMANGRVGSASQPLHVTVMLGAKLLYDELWDAGTRKEFIIPSTAVVPA